MVGRELAWARGLISANELIMRQLEISMKRRVVLYLTDTAREEEGLAKRASNYIVDTADIL